MATKPLVQTARAKVNLCLHVTGQRADGYHLLDSLVVFADYGDQLHFTPAQMVSLSISGPFADGLNSDVDNLILKAARLFGPRGRGAEIELVKNLPVASGIGGGSADAAACVAGLAALWGVAPPSELLGLGADVPVCALGEPVRMHGIGDRLDLLPHWPEMHAVLVNSGHPISTPEVFNGLKSKGNSALTPLPEGQFEFSEACTWLAAQRNDLQDAAQILVPEIDRVLAALHDAGSQLARMSGSGATCFGLFETDAAAQAAAEQISTDQPDWWVRAVAFGGT